MLVAVDIGNTAIKLGWYDALPPGEWPRPSLVLSASTRDAATWEILEQLPPFPADWYVGTVHREAETQLARWVAHHRPHDRYRKLTHTDVPLGIEVEFPERVGIDRLMGAVAADHLRDKNRPAIVIDAGSAVTVDVVSAEGNFVGGIIWPGWRMMAQALAGNTDALPLVTAALSDGPPPIIGTSTEKAIRSGLFWGNVGAVREMVARLQTELPAPAQVFVTGGDAERLTQLACSEARSVPEMVLSGIVLTALKLAA